MAEEAKAKNFNTDEFRSYYNLGAGMEAGNTDIESEDGLSYDEMFERTRVQCEDEVSESGSEDVEMVMSRYDPPVHQQLEVGQPDSLASEIKSAELEGFENEDMIKTYSYVNKTKHLECDITEARLNTDSGTSSPTHITGWNLPSIPPDVVASANHVRVIRTAPRQTFRLDLPRTDCDLADIHGSKTDGKNKEKFPSFCRHQVEAYTNLEDFEDEPWEQSDFEPPEVGDAPVDVVIRAGGEGGGAGYGQQVQGRRRRQRIVHQIGVAGPVQYTCGPQCCVLM